MQDGPRQDIVGVWVGNWEGNRRVEVHLLNGPSGDAHLEIDSTELVPICREWQSSFKTLSVGTEAPRRGSNSLPIISNLIHNYDATYVEVILRRHQP